MPPTKTTVYLDSDDYRTLQAHAAERGESTAELIRQAIHQYVRGAVSAPVARRVSEPAPRYRVAAVAADADEGPAAADGQPSVADRLADLQALLHQRPTADRRTTEEILGYDERGLPR